MYSQPTQAAPYGATPQQTWMERPEAIAGCPPGLEYMATLDQLLIQQQVELFEAMTGIETKNKYAIKNSVGQQCYFAYEESELCHRLCCGSRRGFDMHIVDNMGQEVIRAHREFKCCAGCCCLINGDTCAYAIDVQSPVGMSIGRIVQLCSSWRARYAIQNSNHETMLVIEGPCCVCEGPCCPADVPFDIYTADGSQKIGTLARQYAGLAKEMFTDATNFGLTFPVDLDIKVKAILLSAAFLIDMMFFEQSGDNSNN